MAASDGPAAPKESAPLSLSEAEREILLKACRKYLNSIPAYLKAGEAERSAVAALIKKLSS